MSLSSVRHAEGRSSNSPTRTDRSGTVRRVEPVPRSLNGPGCVEWLAELLSPLAVRRCYALGDRLFSIGDRADHYYLAETGSLLLGRPRRGGHLLRFVRAGQLFIYDCDGIHAASCTALADGRVLAIERRRVEIAAMLDPTLRGVLQSAHARELGMILESLGVEHAVRHITGDAVPSAYGTEEPSRTLLRAHWRPDLAHVVRPA